MAKGLIDVQLQGYENISKTLNRLPGFVKDDFADAMADVIIKELRDYDPPQRYITRKRAYGKTFFSDRQRKWFFWALKSGRINVPYKRTGKMMRAWRKRGRGREVSIQNNSPGIPFVMGDTFQSRHERMVGWDTISKFIGRQDKLILRSAGEILSKLLRRLGWK